MKNQDKKKIFFNFLWQVSEYLSKLVPIKRTKKASFDLQKIPTHIAIIMDGNGRWAQRRGLPRVAGHRMGIEALRRTVNFCGRIGVKYLSVYTFSTENWKRPPQEVNFLMKLLEETIEKEVNRLHENNVRIRFLGNLGELSPEILTQIKKAEKTTQNNTGLTLNIMFNYGGRAEIVEATKKVCEEVSKHSISPSAITPDFFSKFLYTKDIPDPDLLIRTGGEERLSNFLLWQSAYTELWFTQKFWPDFDEGDLSKAIADFQKRKRRFGTLNEE